MRQALCIFRKDFSRLWGVLLIAIPIEVWSQLAYSSPVPGELRFGIAAFQSMAQCFLGVSLIHEEPIPGDRQYWLTRPISWKVLLLAKALFVLAFVCVPVFATDAVTLVTHGQSIIHFLPSLLICQFFLLAFRVLPVAAIAAVTATLSQFVWNSLAAILSYFVIAFTLSTYFNPGQDWGGLTWVRSTFTAFVIFAVAVAVLLLQYRRRNTRASHSILVGGVSCLALCFWMPGWHAAFELQERIGPHQAHPSTISLTFDPDRNPKTQPSTRSNWSGQYFTGISLPVRVMGIPAGMKLYSDRAKVTLTGSDGHTWTSAWDSLHKLSSFPSAGALNPVTNEFIGSGDECWQYLNIDPSFHTAGRTTAHIRIAWAMTLFSQAEITRLGHDQDLRDAPAGGSCLGGVPAGCAWPSQAPQAISVRYRSIQTGAFSDFPISSDLSSPLVNYEPYPTDASIWRMAFSPVYGAALVPPIESLLYTRRAVAHFERELDIPVTASIDPRYVP
jgi:hypothetical protein